MLKKFKVDTLFGNINPPQLPNVAIDIDYTLKVVDEDGNITDTEHTLSISQMDMRNLIRNMYGEFYFIWADNYSDYLNLAEEATDNWSMLWESHKRNYIDVSLAQQLQAYFADYNPIENYRGTEVTTNIHKDATYEGGKVKDTTTSDRDNMSATYQGGEYTDNVTTTNDAYSAAYEGGKIKTSLDTSDTPDATTVETTHYESTYDKSVSEQSARYKDETDVYGTTHTGSADKNYVDYGTLTVTQSTKNKITKIEGGTDAKGTGSQANASGSNDRTITYGDVEVVVDGETGKITGINNTDGTVIANQDNNHDHIEKTTDYGSVTVTSDANGNITITATDAHTNATESQDKNIHTRFGNMGVMTTQQMIEQSLNLYKRNFAEEIVSDFCNKYCIISPLQEGSGLEW